MSLADAVVPREPDERSGGIVRILVADDQEAVRKRICAILVSRRDFEVCAEASTGMEALEKAKALNPDLIILDITMPVLNGLDAARLIRAAMPTASILILSVHQSKQLVAEARRIGVQGYVTKEEGGRRLVQAVDAVLQHQTFFPTET